MTWKPVPNFPGFEVNEAGETRRRHEVVAPAKPSRKYRAQPTNGYASKREAAYAAELELRKSAPNGDVLEWLEQVPIKLPGTRYVVDFLVFHRDGTVSLVEVKGFDHPHWKAKVRALAELRPELHKRLVIVR